jgi:hypothetical protein
LADYGHKGLLYDKFKTGSPFSVSLAGLCLVLILPFTACSNGTTNNPTPQRSTYSGIDSSTGNVYTLEITEDTSRAAAAYTPREGDSYVLTIYSTPVKTSRGTVSDASGSELTLKPENDKAETFTAKVSEAGLGDVKGKITFTDDTTEDVSVTVIPTETPPAPDPVPLALQGTWKNSKNEEFMLTATTSAAVFPDGVRITSRVTKAEVAANEFGNDGDYSTGWKLSMICIEPSTGGFAEFIGTTDQQYVFINNSGTMLFSDVNNGPDSNPDATKDPDNFFTKQE